MIGHVILVQVQYYIPDKLTFFSPFCTTGTSFLNFTAVGKEFLVNRPHQVERTVAVSKRPTKCYLCPVTSKGHAMNLLYDEWGSDGRPLVVKDSSSGKEDIAWVHTLCALVINSNPSTMGCVYGCDEYGRFKNFNATSKEKTYMGDDDGANFSKQIEGVEYIPHHFVQVNKNDKEHAFILNDIRKNNLKCDVCGIPAQKGYFPIQVSTLPSIFIMIMVTIRPRLMTPFLGHDIKCIANDEHECKAFQKKHKNTMECTVAFHVGCARWSTDDTSRIIFQPESEVDDMIVGGYCSLHASNISGVKASRDSGQVSRDFVGAKKRTTVGERGEKQRDSDKYAQSTSVRPTLKKKKPSLDGNKLNRKDLPQANEPNRFLVEMKSDVEKTMANTKDGQGNLIDVLSRCKKTWSQRAVAQNIKGFAKSWKLVEERLATLYPSMRKHLLEQNDPRKSSSANPTSTQSSLEQRHPDVMEAVKANPWSLLWYPNYVQGGCNIEDWETIEEIPPPENMQT